MQRFQHLGRLLSLTLITLPLYACVDQVGFESVQAQKNDDEGPVVCDPFSNGGASDPKNGIRASLHYYEVGDPLISSIKTSNDFVPGKAGVVTSPSTIYMNLLNVPTRSFSDGFVTDGGELMKTMSGEPLIEWFSLRMASNLVAPTVAEEGHYQFALHSDDGAILKIDTDKDGVYENIVNDDSIHAPNLKCATKTVHLKAGEPLPFQLNYFQGPRYHITLQVLWKKFDSARASGLSCDMNQLSVVPAKAYELEAGRKNPCADR